MTDQNLLAALASDDVTYFVGNPQPRNEVDVNGRTLLHRATAANATDVALWVLDNEKPDVNRADLQGETALMRAASLGNTVLVSELLAAGANPRAASNVGGTALHHAYGGGKCVSEVAALLVAAGADPSAQDKSGQTPEAWERYAVAIARGQALLNPPKPSRTLSLRR